MAGFHGPLLLLVLIGLATIHAQTIGSPFTNPAWSVAFTPTQARVTITFTNAVSYVG